jgi:hypothetical protein
VFARFEEDILSFLSVGRLAHENMTTDMTPTIVLIRRWGKWSVVGGRGHWSLVIFSCAKPRWPPRMFRYIALQPSGSPAELLYNGPVNAPQKSRPIVVFTDGAAKGNPGPVAGRR